VPNIGVFHPQIVHFVIAFLCLGVVARVLSLLLGERARFLGPMAATLLILGALITLPAVKSGDDAHGPPERVPGARAAVVEHEDWGKRTRNMFLLIAVVEVAALAFAGRRALARGLLAVSAVGGLVGLWMVYETAEHGGEVVYSYAGGVGIRSGKPEDVDRLLVAGLYHNARLAREDGRKEEAARLTDELVRQAPDDPQVRLLGVESQIKDLNDPRGALVTLAALDVPAQDFRLQIRRAQLGTEAYRAVGAADSAVAMLQDLQQRFPDNPRVKAAVEQAMKPAEGSR
jgi:uncharacterized membrane protein